MSRAAGRTIHHVAATPLLYRRTVHDKNALSLYWVGVVTRFLRDGRSMTDAIRAANEIVSGELAALRAARPYRQLSNGRGDDE